MPHFFGGPAKHEFAALSCPFSVPHMMAAQLLALQRLAPGAPIITGAVHRSRHDREEELLVLLLDHMNDGRGYSGKLAAWCGQLGLRGLQFARTATRRVHAGRLESIVIVVHGSSAGLDELLSRLCSEYVDVNARNQKCKERKSVVLSRGAAPPKFRLPSEPGAAGSLQLHMYDQVESGQPEPATQGCLEDQFSCRGLQSLWSCVHASGLRVKEFQR